MPNRTEGGRQPFLSGSPDLFKGSHRRYFSQGRNIYFLGDNVEPYTVYGVIEGGVELLTSRDGKEITQSVIGPGSLFGFDDWGQDVRSQTARATVNGGIVVQTVLTPEQLYGEDASIRELLIAAMTQRIRDLTTTVTVDLLGDAQARVARALQRFAIENNVGISQGKLANDLGLNRNTVIRTLNGLERAGAIEPRYRSIRIVSPEDLSKHTKR